MQFIDLTLQQERIKDKLADRIDSVLRHGAYIMGPEVLELEAELCRFTKAKHCVTCASGTDALLMTLLSWNIGLDDAVFVPAFTFFATSEVVALLGATPIFVDIDPVTFTMEPDSLERAILAVEEQDATIFPLPHIAKKRRLTPRVIIPVDLFGIPADYETILPLAQKHDLLVLEDAAQAFGGVRGGKRSCAQGCHAAATSFFPAKPLGCYGDGGAIFTDDDELANQLRSIRVHGKGRDKYDNVRLGLNGRLDTLQAAILLEKLVIFQDECIRRRERAKIYARELAHTPLVIVPTEPSGVMSAWAQYSVLFTQGNRDAIARHLRSNGIPSNIYYPKPQHCLSVFAPAKYRPEDMPHALYASQHILSIPFHPYLTEKEQKIVIEVIMEALAYES